MPHGLPRVPEQLLVARLLGVKAWWTSRTLWLNLIVGLLAAGEEAFGFLQPLLPVNVYAVIAFALPLLNAVLRFRTSEGLYFRTPRTLPEIDEGDNAHWNVSEGGAE